MKHKLLLIVTATCVLALGARGQNPATPVLPRSTTDSAAKPAPTPRVAPSVPLDPFGGAGPAPRARPAEDPFVGETQPQPVRPVPAEPEFDPFGPGPTPAQRLDQLKSRSSGANLSARYEVFSLEPAEAASLLRSNHPNDVLYNMLVEMVDEEKAVQETMIVLTTRSAQRAQTSSISEYIYPTEYDKPNSPTAYETRNIGVTVEVEAIVNPQSGMIDLSIAPEHVSLAGKSEWGSPEAKQEMPDFESQRLSTTTQVMPEVPRLLGTISRPPLSKVEKDSAGRIWIAFVTVSHVK